MMIVCVLIYANEERVYTPRFTHEDMRRGCLCLYTEPPFAGELKVTVG